MSSSQHKTILVVALVASVVLGAGVGLALQPDAPASVQEAGDHGMTPAEQCQHMPDMCQPDDGGATVVGE